MINVINTHKNGKTVEEVVSSIKEKIVKEVFVTATEKMENKAEEKGREEGKEERNIEIARYENTGIKHI